MSENMFIPAVREKMKLRIALAGPSGGGKSLGALLLAKGIIGGDWSKVFVIGTVGESILAYANDPEYGIGQFMFYELKPPYSPERFVQAAKAAANAGGVGSLLIIDTFSKMWDGQGGMLEIHHGMSGNSFANWDKLNPRYYGALAYILNDIPCHVICTLRSKMKSVLTEEEDDKGRMKTKVEKVGLEAVFRPGTEYEFPLYLQLNRDHIAEVITKRGNMLPGGDTPFMVDETIGEYLRKWADEGIEHIERPDPIPANVAPVADSGSGNGSGSGSNGSSRRPAPPAPANPQRSGGLPLRPSKQNDWNSYYTKIAPYFGLDRDQALVVLDEAGKDVQRAYDLLIAQNGGESDKVGQTTEDSSVTPPPAPPSSGYTREDYLAKEAAKLGGNVTEFPEQTALDLLGADPETGEIPIPPDDQVYLSGEEDPLWKDEPETEEAE